MSDAETLIAERGKTHGDWFEASWMAAELKHQMRRGDNWHRMPPHQREALEQIAVKISRVLTGDSNEPDHWLDIGGYAALGGKRAPWSAQPSTPTIQS